VIDTDFGLKYFKVCNSDNVLSIPFFNKVQNNQLLIQNHVLNLGLCRAMQAVFQLCPLLLHNLTLDTNTLDGKLMATILQGLLSQKNLKSLTIQSNDIDADCVQTIN
jgi:hypothetical protein